MQDLGASPQELLFEAARRDNTELLHQIISNAGSAHITSDLLNKSTDPLGNTALHIAASSGSLEVLDILLDQEGLEVDPLDRREAETPLHKAVRFVNEVGTVRWKECQMMVDILLDAGADPR